jgi:hypothetical protein
MLRELTEYHQQGRHKTKLIKSLLGAGELSQEVCRSLTIEVHRRRKIFLP